MKKLKSSINNSLSSTSAIHVFSPEMWHGKELTNVFYQELINELKIRYSSKLASLINADNFINLCKDIPLVTGYEKGPFENFDIDDLASLVMNVKPKVLLLDQVQAYHLSKRSGASYKSFFHQLNDNDFLVDHIVVHHKNEVGPLSIGTDLYEMEFPKEYQQFNFDIKKTMIMYKSEDNYVRIEK